ncbi:MAG: type II toxin-antitoxin system HigA family antitoxin [Saprospiraceae bacterium]
MKPISIIKSEVQYFAYCDEVEQLESMETKTKEIENRVELLILLIEKWDQEHQELPELNPVEYLKLLMDSNDLKNVDVQNKVGINKTTLSHIQPFVSGTVIENDNGWFYPKRTMNLGNVWYPSIFDELIKSNSFYKN